MMSHARAHRFKLATSIATMATDGAISGAGLYGVPVDMTFIAWLADKLINSP